MTSSGHKHKQTPIRFTEADQARIRDLQARHPSETGAERSVAEIVRIALKRWHDAGKTGKKKS